MVHRLLIGAISGGLAGAISSWILFTIGASSEGGTGFSEAAGYGIIVAMILGFLGAVVGVVIGMRNMRWTGGALVGIVMTVLVIAFYVTAFKQSLGESMIILFVSTVPLVLAGVVAAWAVGRVAS